MIPTDEEFVESVAKAIAKSRLRRDADEALINILQPNIEGLNEFEKSFDVVFESLWNISSPVNLKQKSEYMADARSAISVINLKLLTINI